MSLSLNLFAQADKSFIVLKNPLNLQRDSELIVLSRKKIESKIGKLQPNEYVRIYKENATPLVVQFDDINQDGIWDEAVFLYSFKPEETVTLKLKKSETLMDTNVQPLAHVRMKLKNADDKFGPSVKHVDMPYQNKPTDFSKHALPTYLTEGPGWENDKVAFRLYFDTRNAKDIYGKRIPGMVMDTVGANPKNSYHKLSAWGMDILAVGKSLGAGGLAFSYKLENGKDTLVRLGELNIKSESYDEIADGPIRAIFKMDYHWELNHQPVEVVEYISIWGGQYFYQSKIFVKGHHLPKDLKVDMGIANFYDNRSGNFSSGNTKVLYSFGKQSEIKDDLGMAIFSRAEDFSKFWSIGKEVTAASDITQTYLSEEKVNSLKPAVYRYFACWNKTNTLFKDENNFVNFLHSEAEKFSNPIITLIKNKK
ncbi:hypothetical protein A9P82_06670 [Arachidicoccus ginsenosidimutans]|nr:hypothetical protein A9P82_06670 [Arachidicoccus sp. BS20]